VEEKTRTATMLMAAEKGEPVNCPSCGRLTGGGVRCDYCCTLVSPAERITVRSLNLSTIVLFIAAFLYFAISMTLKPVYTPISELNESKAFERVRVLGKVTRVNKFPDKYGKRITIQVEIADAKVAEGDYDETIRVKSEGDVSADMIKKGLIPQEGDMVDVTASLFAGKGFRTLSLGSAEFMRVVGKSPDSVIAEATIAQLLGKPDDYKDKKVRIKEAVVASKKSKIVFEAADADMKNRITVFGADADALTDNQKISICGKFVYYDKGEYWEIKVFQDDANGIVPLTK